MFLCHFHVKTPFKHTLLGEKNELISLIQCKNPKCKSDDYTRGTNWDKSHPWIFQQANLLGRATPYKKREGGLDNGAFKLLPLQFRRCEWVYWIMDLFIGVKKKEKQQSWYQSGLKPLDLWGFSPMAGGACLNLPFISLGLIKTRPPLFTC